MALPLLVFALPGDEPGSARQLLAVVRQDHDALRWYIDVFRLGPDGQPRATVATFENASKQLGSLKKHLQGLLERYRRYPRQQYKIVLSDAQMYRLWLELTEDVKKLSIQLEKTKRSNYLISEIWLNLDSINIVYEDIAVELGKISDHETQISRRKNG